MLRHRLQVSHAEKTLATEKRPSVLKAPRTRGADRDVRHGTDRDHRDDADRDHRDGARPGSLHFPVVGQGEDRGERPGRIRLNLTRRRVNRDHLRVVGSDERRSRKKHHR